MGYELYREVKKWAPESLTHREKLTAMVLADDANDKTRLTYSSVVDPDILQQAMIKNSRDMLKIIARLQDEKVIEKAVRGNNGKVAKYRFLHLTPPFSSGLGGEKGGEKEAGTGLKGVQNEHPTGSVGRSDRTPYGSGGEEKEHPTDAEGCSFSTRRVSKTNTPTPPTSSTTSSSAPPSSPDPDASTHEGGGGGDAHDDEHKLAAAFLRQLPAPWTAGRATAEKLAPLLLSVTAETGWHLDDSLAAKITENPGGINDYRAVLRTRIGDLPNRVQSARPASAPKCGECDETGFRYRDPIAETGAYRCPCRTQQAA